MASTNIASQNTFVRSMRKIYHLLGFSKGYNALLWLIFDGAMLGFVLARFQYLNVWGIFCGTSSSGGNSASPGECYWYTTFARNKIGIVLHLATILPAGFLVVFQFVPVIRHKAILYHRVAGYIILLLTTISNAGALMVANHAFGGDYQTQAWVGLSVIVTTTALVLAYVNIKRLQIEQHRAWMLRAWFYFASIITLRIIMVIAALIESKWPASQTYVTRTCEEIAWTYNHSGLAVARFYQDFPVCQSEGNSYVPILADFHGDSPVEIGAGLGANFGMAGMLALFLHAVGIEIYLYLTPKEFQRLRQISYAKQLEAGFKNPGSAGLVIEKFGDADQWLPKIATHDLVDKISPHASVSPRA